ncbi:sodium:proton antiporter [Candidatus Deferrimicrobium sp.]|uniref:sodium:proton antiporter n=1 Tax=Candidatus Deferrimicrobium sp. TaxID=3060586 RepID=UPI002EDB7818
MPPHDPIALGASLPLWSVVPFAGLLLSIALFPLFAPSVWARHYAKVCLAFGVPVACFFLLRAPRELLHTTLEYASFLILLASLFTISGGILLRGTLRGSAGVNCAILAVGALLANVFGTTGASMLLIRPLLRANAHRRRAAHVVVFFIFVVANIGGALTPIGDPPLFLGYLRGVPFFWTLRAMVLPWAFACALVIGAFYLVDRRALALEKVAAAEDEGDPARAGAPDTVAGAGEARVPLSIEGKINLPLLMVVIGAVFLPTPWREMAMAAAAGVSAWKTPAKVRKENEFTWYPIEEVAILFAGIFATMIPALLILKARGAELGVVSPAHFFWVTGTLSSFLDNAPTYLTFFSLAQGVGGAETVAGVSAPLLQAISAGAVFMGANSYIGNAPNFMVKAIAEEAGVRMPSFFGYMAWSCGILLPIFALLTLIFF